MVYGYISAANGKLLTRFENWGETYYIKFNIRVGKDLEKCGSRKNLNNIFHLKCDGVLCSRNGGGTHLGTDLPSIFVDTFDRKLYIKQRSHRKNRFDLD